MEGLLGSLFLDDDDDDDASPPPIQSGEEDDAGTSTTKPTSRDQCDSVDSLFGDTQSARYRLEGIMNEHFQESSALLSMPSELLLRIMGMLRPTDLPRLACVCKMLAIFIRTEAAEEVWRAVHDAHYGGAKGGAKWKESCIRTYHTLRRGRSPLAVALGHDHHMLFTRELQQRAEEGREVDIMEPVAEVCVARTLLQESAMSNCSKICRALLRLGADVNGVTPQYPSTPLSMALSKGHAEVAQVLLSSAEVEFGRISREEREQCAMRWVDAGRLDLLSQFGRDVPVSAVPALLHHAVGVSVEMFRLLKNFGCPISVHNGRSLMERALRSASDGFAIFELLKDGGYVPTMEDGQRCISAAASTGRIAPLRWLCEDLHIPVTFTSIVEAVQHSRAEAVIYLVDKFVELEKQPLLWQQLLLRVLIRMDGTELASLLLSRGASANGMVECADRAFNAYPTDGSGGVRMPVLGALLFFWKSSWRYEPDVNKVILLLDHGADPNARFDPPAPGSPQTTPALLSLCHGFGEVLLSYGADFSVTDSLGSNAYYYMVMHSSTWSSSSSHLRMREHLYSLVLDVNAPGYVNTDSRRTRCMTVLEALCYVAGSHHSAAQYLLSIGANPNAYVSTPPIFYFAMASDDVIEAFVKAGTDFAARSTDGDTILETQMWEQAYVPADKFIALGCPPRS